MDASTVADRLQADLGLLLARARAGFLAAVPEFADYPQPVLDKALLATQRNVETFVRYLRTGTLDAQGRLAMTEQSMGMADALLTDDQLMGLARALATALRETVPDAADIVRMWSAFLAEATLRTVPGVQLGENALADLEHEEVDFA